MINLKIHLREHDAVIVAYLLNSLKKYTKKALIKQHGKDEGKSKYEVYKDLMKSFKNAERKDDIFVIDVKRDQYSMLKDFLEGYIKKVKQEDENHKDLQQLEIIHTKIKGVSA